MEQGKKEISRTVPGINIQWPWSSLLICGKKSVETRRYPLPSHYLGKELALIETPGPRGGRLAGIANARIIGLVVFESNFEYISRADWLKDRDQHLVMANDTTLGFNENKPNWGWRVQRVVPFNKFVSLPKSLRRGIKYTSKIKLTDSIGFQ